MSQPMFGSIRLEDEEEDPEEALKKKPMKIL
jgi:hypothetical protein